MVKFSVKKPLTVFVAVILVLVLGFTAYFEMTPDLLPNLDFPYAVVITTYPGASPEQVETTVTKPLEQSMATLDKIKNITSTSSENYSMVMMEFSDDANMDSITVDIRGNIDKVKGYWPEEISTPILMKINPNMLPVTVAAVSYEGKDTAELSNFINDSIMNNLEGVEGVASVSASGLLEQGVNVVISQEKIDSVNQKIQDAIEGKFDEAREEIDSAKTEIDSGLTQAQSGQQELVYSKEQLEQKEQEAQSQLSQAESELDAKAQEIAQAKLQLIEGINQIESQKESLNTVYSQVLQIVESKDELLAAREELAGQLEKLESEGLGDSEEALEIKNKTAEIDSTFEAINAILEPLGYSVDTIDEAATYLEQQIESLTTAEKELQDKLAHTEQGEVSLQQAQDELEAQKNNVNSQIQSGKNQISGAESQLNSTIDRLNQAKSQLYASSAKIDEQEQQALDGADISETITMDMVSSILTAQNFSMPSGYVNDTEGTQYLVRVGDEFSDITEMENLQLFDMGIEGLDPIKLSDVADVFITDNSDEIFAKINGADGVLLSFTKQSNYATADVSDNISERFTELSEKYPGIEFISLMSQGDYIHLIIDGVINNMILGAVFAIIVLLFFLKDVKPTLVIAVSIPISVIFAIVLMYFSGVTLNMISLSGLAIGVGMLVDNSVVVIENIYRLRNLGVPAHAAAVKGAKEMAAAITSSTLTTVCVFLPIVFIQGITKQLFVDMALTIAYSLLASLIVALTLVPALSSTALKKTTTKEHKWFDKALKGYEKSIQFTLRNRGLALLAAFLLLVGSTVGALARGFSFMPDMSSNQISITATLPYDSSYEDTEQTAQAILDVMESYPQFETTASMAGNMGSVMGMAGTSDNTGSVTAYGVLKDEYAKDSSEISKSLEKDLENINAEITVSGGSSMSSMSTIMGGTGVTVNIYGDDLDTMKQTAESVAKTLSQIEGIGEVDSGTKETTPVIKITVDKEKASENGLTVAQVYAAVNEQLSWSKTATSLKNSDGSSLDVIVIDENKENTTPEDISNMTLTVTGMDGEEKEIPLTEVASVSEQTTPDSISRDNQRRYVTVTAEVKDGYILSHVASEVENKMESFEMPAGFSYDISGENASTMEAVWQVLKMLALAIVFIYLIMVAQFQNFKSPFIVMFTIPLVFTGGFLALLITGNDVSVMSLLGFVMLSGIIVNNGIVLIDCINRLQIDEGMTKKEAIVKAGVIRMRPILMTALTTVLGLSVMALGIGTGSEMMQPVAIVCIGGLIYATFMTLYIVPVMYDLMNKKPPKAVKDEDLEFEIENVSL